MQRIKNIAIVTVAAATGATVAVAGGIGFVGIVVPHMLRLSIGPDHRYLLPASALLGATLLLLADAVSRTIVAPAELPIGIITALLARRSSSGYCCASAACSICEAIMIETKALGVSLSGKTIISDIAFSANPGEVTAIVGPNGSGKTTLLRALAGDVAYTGTAYLDGRSFAEIKPWQMAARRAVLPQASALSFPFTVREIVKIGLTGGYSGVSREEEKRLPDLALQRVDLAGFGGRLYQELSGGEQQRVQLARVLCQVWKPVVDGEARYLFWMSRFQVSIYVTRLW